MPSEPGMWPRPVGSSGISRTRYYQWKTLADRYGLEALVPKARRAPQMPEATPTHVIQALLTLAVVEPTIGCRQTPTAWVTRASPWPSRRCRSTWWPMAGDDGPSAWPGRR